ncbi:MAG: GNAT family N-acetyltransferase [Fimbriimonadaceae bacterium]|jgi:RimJ/RimL family protein N-acetyltransferase|nr:GNAT family N-acetyltransferase [Fimbriimonadaceae bacterium]
MSDHSLKVKDLDLLPLTTEESRSLRSLQAVVEARGLHLGGTWIETEGDADQDLDPVLIPGFGPWLVIKPVEGQKVVVGVAGFTPGDPFEGSATLGFQIMPEFQRQGIASAVGSALCAWAFGNIEVGYINCFVQVGHEAGTSLVNRLGFVQQEDDELEAEGSLWYCLTRSDLKWPS